MSKSNNNTGAAELEKEYKSSDDISTLELDDEVQSVVDPKDSNERSTLYSKKVSEKPKKSGKNIKETINTSIQPMKKTDINIFDKLYSTIMEDGFDFDDEFPPLDDTGEDADGGEPEADSDTEGEVTVTLSGDQVDALRDILAQLDGDDEEDGDLDIEDLVDGEDGDDEEDPFGEAVDAETVSDSKGKSLQGTNNKVGKVKGKGGKASKGDPKNEPEPKELSDAGGKALQNPKNDKPAGSTVTPGDALK
jgi:hypothetical protein